jgi:hypothetical protein
VPLRCWLKLYVPSLHCAVAPAGGSSAATGRGTQLPSLLRYSSAVQTPVVPPPPPPAAAWVGAAGPVVAGAAATAVGDGAVVGGAGVVAAGTETVVAGGC